MATANTKVKVSTDTHTDTKTSVENGVTVKTTTTKTTDRYSDGSTATTTDIHTVRQEELPGTAQFLGGSNNSKYTRQVPAVGQPVTATPAITGYSGNIPQTNLATDEKFIQDAVYSHNKHRTRHGVAPLILNLDLCKFAQQWANVIASKGSMDHSGYGYGENIYWNSGNVTDGSIPVDYWYSEVKAFNWDHNDFQKGTGLFTQVIWKNSREIGIARTHSQKGTFVVALYNPAGNVIGEFPANVLKPMF